MWIKARHVPNKEGEMFPRRKNIPRIKSTYERRLANGGVTKGGSWF